LGDRKVNETVTAASGCPRLGSQLGVVGLEIRSPGNSPVEPATISPAENNQRLACSAQSPLLDKLSAISTQNPASAIVAARPNGREPAVKVPAMGELRGCACGAV
jgi:hypothetical protein